MSARLIDPIVTAATMFSVDRMLAARDKSLARPASNDVPALGAYWAAAVALLGEDLALRIAADLPIGALGLASYSSVSAPTLGGALEALSTTHLDRMIPGMTLRVLPARDQVDVRLHGDDDALMPLLEEIGLAVIYQHLALLSTPARVYAVELRRPAPSNPAPWRAYFGVAPRFAQRYSVLRLDAASLASPLRTASPELHTIVATTSAQVRSYVRAHLAEELDAGTVARALGLTSRTLQRKLQAEDTSLREVAAAVRIDVARELLEHTDRTIADISETVGFAQPASFTRAFTAAAGEPPADFRKRVRA